METVSYQKSEYARSLIEASLDPLFTINPDGKITDINDATIEVTHVSREKMIGSDFIRYFTEPEKARNIYKKVFAEGFVTGYPLTIRDGTLTDVLFNGSVFKDQSGKVIGVVVVARDISAQNKIEKELKDAIEDAETSAKNAITAKTRAEKATHLAEDAVRSKQQFLSNMSHEIRTPLNVIIGFTKVLMKSKLTRKQQEHLAAIKMSGETLIVLINDILDLAKVNAGKMIFEKLPFNMKTSVSAMIQVFVSKAQEKNIKLTIEYDDTIPRFLVGDTVRLHQIVLNLLSNAVKFTNEGHITVKVNLVKDTKDEVVVGFIVSDTGIGIDKDKIKNIFKNFQQATSETSRIYGGTGLGLAISKKLVEAQGGSISVKSKLGEGSWFKFELPFKKTSVNVEEEPVLIDVDPQYNNIKVLVAEDMKLNQLLIKTLLADFGFDYDIVSTGKQVIKRLQSKQYDIILMDLQMPEMNGFDATSYIRNDLNLKIPIIALTADVTTVDLQKCNAAGMDDYISKPIDEKLLYSKIVSLIRKPSSGATKKASSINLTYLDERTKRNRKLMQEMIDIFLEQTPQIIDTMKSDLAAKNWDGLRSSAHKMIPSFSIVGIDKVYEDMARKIQENTRTQKQLDEVPGLVAEIEKICAQACKELKEYS